MRFVSETVRRRWVAVMLAVLVTTPAARAVKIGDITHLQGSRVNKLVGYGLVMGLNGTGDGDKYLATMRMLAQAHRRFANPVLTLDELKGAKNVAVVEVEATLPRDGVREGDMVDVKVSSVGAAKSLLGGRLLITPLVGPHPDDPRGVMAMAGGRLQLENPEVPTVARIAQGATLEQNWIHNYVALGRDLDIYKTRSSVRPLDWLRPDEPYVTFVIDDPLAEWGIASTIAQAINEEESIPDGSGESRFGIATGDLKKKLAVAFDPRTVAVRVPPEVRANPAPFLARIESLQFLMPFTEARVTIHRSSGNIVITGDVEIAPAVITHKGLTITTMIPEQPATAENPRAVTSDWGAIDPQKKGGTKLTDLLEALSQLRVPDQDKITIIEQLEKTGKIYATLIVDD